MKPNSFIKKLREYPLSSHAAWVHARAHHTVLKLDWNEADVQLPKAVKKAVVDFVEHGPTHWYPDIANMQLITAIARYMSVSPATVQYFVGEDSALDYIVRTFVSDGDEVGLISPTYDNFRVYVESVGAVPKYLFTPDLFTADIRSLASQISARTKLVYLVNPNNPTGVIYSVKDIAFLLQKFPKTLFVVDEAYGEFCGCTTAALVSTYPNLVVARSFSKAFGLASFRLGYIMTAPENLVQINKIRNGKSVPAVAQIAGVAALKQVSYMHRYVTEVRASRNIMARGLEKLGYSIVETPANFLLVEVTDPETFCKALEKENVFVRNLNHLPHMQSYVRITVGSRKSTRQLLNTLSTCTSTPTHQQKK